jgi:hypothetical protein
MCFVKPKNNWGLLWPHWEELFLDINQIWKESPIEILRKTSKLKKWAELSNAQKEIKKIVDKHIAKLPKRDNWDKI